jgi:hypothetical protein
VTVQPHAKPPDGKLLTLQDIDPGFRATWHRERKDMKDQSGSGYDQSLADQACAAGWTHQEITDLMINAAVRHAEPVKTAHYYRYTIWKAAHLHHETTAHVTLEAHEAGFDRELSDDERRTKILESLSTLWGHAFSLTRHNASPPQFYLEAEQGRVYLGGIEAIDSQRVFRQKFAALTNHLIPRCTDKAWQKRAQALLDAAKPVDVGPEGSDEEALRAWLVIYLETFPILSLADERRELAWHGTPIVEHQRVHICLTHFSRWLLEQVGNSSPLLRGIPSKLTNLTCEHSKVNYRKAGRRNQKLQRTSRSTYMMPQKLIEDAGIELSQAGGE